MAQNNSGLEDAAASSKPGKLSNCGEAFDNQNSTKSAPKKQAPHTAATQIVADHFEDAAACTGMLQATLTRARGKQSARP